MPTTSLIKLKEKQARATIDWTSIKNEFNYMPDVSKQYILDNVGTNQDFADVISLHNYLVSYSVNHSLSYDSFINSSIENPLDANPIGKQNSNVENATIQSVLLIGLFGLTTLMGYFYLKKKQSN